MINEALFEVIRPETIVDGQRVESVINLVTTSEVSGVQVKDSGGKHIEVKLRVPYSEPDLGALGDMFGEKIDIAMQAVRYYEPDLDEGQADLFEGESEDFE